MKITENEVEVVKHQSVIAPLLLLLWLLLLFATVGRALLFRHRRPRSCEAREDAGLKLTGCCFELQKGLHFRCAQREEDDGVKINEQR